MSRVNKPRAKSPRRPYKPRYAPGYMLLGTHGYRHELDDAQHKALSSALRAFSGMVVLSGYPSELYDRELYPDWERFERRHVADGGKQRTEVVWLNTACSEALRVEAGGLF